MPLKGEGELNEDYELIVDSIGLSVIDGNRSF